MPTPTIWIYLNCVIDHHCCCCCCCYPAPAGVRPGFRMASVNPGQAINATTQTGVVCPANKYSVGGTRLSSCTNCPSGMVTVGDLAANHNSINDCRECCMPVGFSDWWCKMPEPPAFARALPATTVSLAAQSVVCYMLGCSECSEVIACVHCQQT
jgi:hypothetical protein